jgi:hypothetical protein
MSRASYGNLLELTIYYYQREDLRHYLDDVLNRRLGRNNPFWKDLSIFIQTRQLSTLPNAPGKVCASLKKNANACLQKSIFKRLLVSILNFKDLNSLKSKIKEAKMKVIVPQEDETPEELTEDVPA